MKEEYAMIHNTKCTMKEVLLSIKEKYLALTNMEAGVKAVEYFIRTGKLYPGIDWAEQL